MAADESVGPVQLLPATHPEEEHEQLGHEEAEHEVRSEGFDFARLVRSCAAPLLGSFGTCAVAGGSPRLPGTSRLPSRSRRIRGRCAEVARSERHRVETGKPKRE